MTVLIKHWHDIYNSREATEHGVNLYSTVAFQFAPRARLIQTYFDWWDSGSEQGVTLFMAISYYAICILARRHFWQHMFLSKIHYDIFPDWRWIKIFGGTSFVSKNLFPDGESNPGRRGESAES